MMKTIHRTIFLLMCLPLWVQPGLPAQEAGRRLPEERVALFTDRTLYVAGEDILFSAFVIPDAAEGSDKMSLVLYCELLAPDGKKFSDGKYPVAANRSAGALPLPSDLVTGVYYFRAYTRYMRNFGPGAFTYVAVKIINPNREDFLPGDAVPADGMSRKPESPDESIRIVTGRKQYTPGESIRVRLSGIVEDSLVGLCMAVIPDAAWNPQPAAVTLPAGLTGLKYYPETRGLTLSGSATDKTSGKPLTEAVVNLTMISSRDFMAVNTGQDGRFFFALPAATGMHDLFISASVSEEVLPEIKVDNDFCPDIISLPSPAFSLSDEERSLAVKMAANIAIAPYFQALQPQDTTAAPPLAFYGKPDMVLHFDKYIQLPTLEEYFSELSGPVQVRKRKGRKMIKVYSEEPEMALHRPLLLIDLVAVDDIDRVLAFNPLGIERAEVVDRLYVKGGITYGGIVSVISRKNDFAGFDLPSSGLFLNYQFFREADGFLLPSTGNDTIPDTRNTLMWVPYLSGGRQADHEISFPASGMCGQFRIIARGLTAGGRIIETSATLEIIKP